MKVLKKLFVLTLVFGVIMALAACGGSKKTNSSSSSDSGGKKTLTVSVEDQYADYINSIKGDFEKQNNVTVKVVKKPMFDQLEALPLDGPTGKAPDVMLASYDRIGGLGQQGHLLELSKKDVSAFDAKDQRQVTIDNKVYGVPFVIETLVLYYNKDLISSPPKTFSDLEKLAKDSKYAFKSEPGKNTGFLVKWTDFYYACGLLAGYGGYVFGDNGTNIKDIGLNNEGSVKAITYATHWFQDIWPKGMKDTKSSGDFVTEEFSKGKAAAVIDGPWSAANYTKAKVNYGVAPIPTLPNGKEYQAFGGGKGWVASNYTKEPKLAEKWIKYVTNAENDYKFFEKYNEIPANPTAREKAASTNNELAKAVAEQYKSAQPMPNIPEMAEVWTGMESTMYDAAVGKKTPKQAADAAVKTIKDNIAQKYSNK
ncbi:sugar ABC transporter substrate-binding protein [Weizmannia acidilactici]|uniref:Maltodextrin-binding protein n=1 Tax=Weizmannia acidilactici TaxID=2607726 RepID=A0A5J4JHE0_9BACI|nr:extracellular solute-binding protein [Weizmannia acidilactici]GER71523.1 sugar ABC transporter substrate-binding protein [Weizmannia acidilactici]